MRKDFHKQFNLIFHFLETGEKDEFPILGNFIPECFMHVAKVLEKVDGEPFDSVVIVRPLSIVFL
jgi:hypothetical protein